MTIYRLWLMLVCAVPLALAAVLFLAPDEARAQATGYCTPIQTVSATPDADGVYTTTLVCADTSAAAGEADYRQLHYNHRAAYGPNDPDRDSAKTNNNEDNHLSITLGSGVVFTADKYMDHRTVPTDGAIVLWNAGGGDKTVTVQDGAIINLERTPEYWHPTTDADRRVVRMEGGDVVYDYRWYPTWGDALDSLTAIAAHSNTDEGDSDVTVRLDGKINIDINVGGTYGKNDYYDASAGRAIDVQIKDTGSTGDARADLDALVELGPTGVIRQVEGSDGLGGIYVENRSEEGDITINLAEGSLIDVSDGGGYGILAIGWTHSNNNGAKTGDMIINAAGTIRTALPQGRVQSNNFGHGIFASQGADGRLLVTSSGTIEAVQASAIDARAYASTNMHSDNPDTPEIEGHLVDVTAGTVEARGNTAIYTSTGSINADMTVRVAAGATVRAQALTEKDYENGAATQAELGTTGNGRLQLPRYRFYGWRQVQVMEEAPSGEMVEVTKSEPIIVGIAMRDYTSDAAAEGVMDQMLVDGTVEAVGGKADIDPAIWMERGGRLVVGATGRVSADSGLAIEAGCVSEYRSGFTDPGGATTDCDSKPPRNLEVTVAGTVDGDIRLRGDGDLTATVAGTVDGDIRTMGAGALTLSVPEGGVVTGTVRDPAGPLTVAGSIGRLLYSGGATVTVAATGALTGVEGEALRSETGDLDVTVAGMVAGDLRAPGGGTLKLSVLEGGAIPGTAYDPVGPLTVAGSIGRLLYSGGATVTVAATGALTGVEGEAIRSEAGNLDVTVAGMVTGDVLGLGAGDHTVRVAQGGAVTGTIHLAASTVTVDGSAGEVRLDRGGSVTVGRTGRVAGGVGIRSETGDFTATVAGTVDGDVRVLGSGEHTVTVAAGGRVTGSVRVSTRSGVMLGGAVGKVHLDRGGMVTIGESGRVTGLADDDTAIRSGSGELAVVIRQAADETAAEAANRVRGRIEEQGGRPEVLFQTAGAAEPRALGAPGARFSAPIGAFDVGVVPDGDGVRLDRAYAPRSRVYEALPSVLLGLNRLPEFRERAARAPGGGWAQVEAFSGEWDAAGSTTPGLEYGYRRHGLRAGFDAAVTGNGLFGVSAHRRGGSADVSNGGRMELSGAGVGVSWASRFADAAYMDLKAEWTWYEADLFSSLRGALKKKARARGHALGVEIGRRAAAGGLVLTPRVQMVRSTVSAKGFTDAVGARVSPTGGRSLTGAAGVAAELDAAPGTRVFGALDAEREFSAERKVRVSGEELRSSADAMWFRVRLGGAHAWNDGRYAFRGEASYATAGDSREFGGGVGLRVRF